jgi:hypothetical protein
MGQVRSIMEVQVPESIRRHADYVMRMLEQPAIVEQITQHRDWLVAFKKTWQLSSLPTLTWAVIACWGQPLRRLLWEDLSRLTEAMKQPGFRHSRRLFGSVSLSERVAAVLVDRSPRRSLFVQSPSGWSMPLPPLSKGPRVAVSRGILLMHRWNGASAASRGKRAGRTSRC